MCVCVRVFISWSIRVTKHLWVRVALGTSCLEDDLYRVRYVLGTSCPDHNLYHNAESVSMLRRLHDIRIINNLTNMLILYTGVCGIIVWCYFYYRIACLWFHCDAGTTQIFIFRIY